MKNAHSFFVLLAFISCSHAALNAEDFARLRQHMVATQLKGRDINDLRVLGAMQKVERHLFVDKSYLKKAYYDGPLPIAGGQTISQPYIVALMTQLLALAPGDSVLEIGTGSGYQTAVLAELAHKVYSIEIVPVLCQTSQELLVHKLAYKNIWLKCSDGYAGWEEHAPFEKIILTAAPPVVPVPLKKQLAPGGIIVAPVGQGLQHLVVLRKSLDGQLKEERKIAVRFVPMTGKVLKK